MCHVTATLPPKIQLGTFVAQPGSMHNNIELAKPNRVAAITVNLEVKNKSLKTVKLTFFQNGSINTSYSVFTV